MIGSKIGSSSQFVPTMPGMIGSKNGLVIDIRSYNELPAGISSFKHFSSPSYLNGNGETGRTGENEEPEMKEHDTFTGKTAS